MTAPRIVSTIPDSSCAEERLAAKLDGWVHDAPQQRTHTAKRSTHFGCVDIRVVRSDSETVRHDVGQEVIAPHVASAP